jgi:hypothetical protein
MSAKLTGCRYTMIARTSSDSLHKGRIFGTSSNSLLAVGSTGGLVSSSSTDSVLRCHILSGTVGNVS